MEEIDGSKRSSPFAEVRQDFQGDASAKKARTNAAETTDDSGSDECVHAMQSLQTKTSSILSPGHHHDPDLHVHFPRNVHGPDVFVDLVAPECFCVHIGFLQIHRRYEARFVLKHGFGPELCAPPLQNSEVVTIREVTSTPPNDMGEDEGSNCHSICLEIHTVSEGICKEDLLLTTGGESSKSVRLIVYAQVLARDKGPPLLKEGVKCVGTDKDIESDPPEKPKMTGIKFSEPEAMVEAEQNRLKKPGRGVRFGAEKLSPVDEDSVVGNRDGHVHFPDNLHGPELQVAQTGQDCFSVNLGFLQIHRTYHAKFTLRHSFGPGLSAPPLQSVYVSVKEIRHNVDSEGEGGEEDSHTLVVEICTEKAGVVTEKLSLTTEDDATKKMWVELHARVMGKGKGTPLLKEGVRCVKVNVEEDSEVSDWAGF